MDSSSKPHDDRDKLDLNFTPEELESRRLAETETLRLPEKVRMKIDEKRGREEVRPVLVIQKALSTTDLDRDQNRFFIRGLQNEFLTEEEDRFLQQKNGSRYNFMTVPIIEPSGEVRSIPLKKWRSCGYVLTPEWENVVDKNDLQEGQIVQLWAFRIKEELNFAFVFPEIQAATDTHTEERR